MVLECFNITMNHLCEIMQILFDMYQNKKGNSYRWQGDTFNDQTRSLASKLLETLPSLTSSSSCNGTICGDRNYCRIKHNPLKIVQYQHIIM